MTCQACPKICQCKWKHGKVWVICSNANFIDVPLGLDSATQVLDLSKNNLKILFRDAFIDRGLINLQKVFLVDCKLIKVDKHSFRRLINLVELNLAYNLLTEMPSEVLTDIPGLRVLNLKMNNISVIKSSSFIATPDLVHLDLSFNSIKIIEKSAFKPLFKLEILKLSGNKIEAISDNLFRSLKSLRVLHLHSNNWNCDCKLRPIVKWMNKQNFASTMHPQCILPKHLQKVQWQYLDPNQLFCVPIVTALTPRMLAMNGDNVTLSCKVKTESEANVTWHNVGKSLSNDTLILEDDSKYDVIETVTNNEDGQTTISNLTIFEANFSDEGLFQCLVENEAGIVQTNINLQISEVIKEDPLVANEDSFILTGTILGSVILVTLLIIIIVSFVCFKKISSNSSVRSKSSEKILCQCDDREFSSNSVADSRNDIPPPKCSCPDSDPPPSVEIIPKCSCPHIPPTPDIKTTSFTTNESSKQMGGHPITMSDKQRSFDTNFVPLKNKEIEQCEISFVEVPQVRFPYVNQGSRKSSKNLQQKASEEKYSQDILQKCQHMPSYCTLSRRYVSTSTFLHFKG